MSRFLKKQTQGKTKRRDSKNPSYKNKQREHYSEKNFQKRKLAKKGIFRQESR